MRIILTLLLAFPVLGQSYEAGTVLGWETATYSQSAHIARNEVVYRVRVGGATYKITRERESVELTAGQVRCRVKSKSLYILRENGKEKKFEIVAVE